MPDDEPMLPCAGITANLGEQDRAMLASYGSFGTAPSGTVLIRQGHTHGRLFCVVSGKFEARRECGGGSVLLGSISPGEWIGEVDIFAPSNPMCSVSAAEPSRYWAIPREKFEEFINDNKNAAIVVLIGLASTLGTRIRGITERLAAQAQPPADTGSGDVDLRSAADLAAAFLRQKDGERLGKRLQ